MHRHWLSLWPWLGQLVRAVFFDGFMIAVVGGIIVVGLLVSGLVLRRKPATTSTG